MTPGLVEEPLIAADGEPLAKMPRLDDVDAAKTNKSELNSTCSKIVRRVMAKGEIAYETYPSEGGFQATVQMSGLPEPWSSQVFAGEVRQKKADAEQSAAGYALDALKQDPDMMAAFSLPPKPKNWPPPSKGFGKGFGKGKGKGKWGFGNSSQGIFLGGISSGNDGSFRW